MAVSDLLDGHIKTKLNRNHQLTVRFICTKIPYQDIYCTTTTGVEPSPIAVPDHENLASIPTTEETLI